MTFNSIDKEYYENKIIEDEKPKKITEIYKKGLLVTIGFVLFAIIGISNSESVIISGITVFPGISDFFVTFSTAIQYLIFINEIEKIVYIIHLDFRNKRRWIFCLLIIK